MVPPFAIASRFAPARARSVAARAIPDDARAELGELVGRVAPGEHVEHALEARCAGDRRRARRGARASRCPRRRSRPRGSLAVCSAAASRASSRPAAARGARGCRPRRWRRSAARARRAGCARSTSPRRRRSRCPRRRPRTRGDRAVLRDEHARGTPPTWWLARPMRWSPDATDGGASTWMTRSTAPMSMPSSSDDVATIAGRSPRLSRSSMTRALPCATEPWCASAISSPAISLSAVARRSARRRLLTKIIVERARADALDDARVEVRPDRCARSGRRRRRRRARPRRAAVGQAEAAPRR